MEPFRMVRREFVGVYWEWLGMGNPAPGGVAQRERRRGLRLRY